MNDTCVFCQGVFNKFSVNLFYPRPITHANAGICAKTTASLLTGNYFSIRFCDSSFLKRILEIFQNIFHALEMNKIPYLFARSPATFLPFFFLFILTKKQIIGLLLQQAAQRVKTKSEHQYDKLLGSRAATGQIVGYQHNQLALSDTISL